jgi:excisionase family DNA binding protein
MQRTYSEVAAYSRTWGEIASVLGVSVSTAKRLAKRGEINVWRFGGVVHADRADLKRALRGEYSLN